MTVTLLTPTTLTENAAFPPCGCPPPRVDVVESVVVVYAEEVFVDWEVDVKGVLGAGVRGPELLDVVRVREGVPPLLDVADVLLFLASFGGTGGGGPAYASLAEEGVGGC